MTLSLAAVDLDCENALRVAEFWSAALDRPIEEGASRYFARIPATESAPTMMFLGVPEAKTVKNRVHLDLYADDRSVEVERLVSLGATHVADKDEWGYSWVVMADVEGNEFCVAEPHPT
jgi:predicted enzyme related to lactoylglutathione lyase